MQFIGCFECVYIYIYIFCDLNLYVGPVDIVVIWEVGNGIDVLVRSSIEVSECLKAGISQSSTLRQTFLSWVVTAYIPNILWGGPDSAHFTAACVSLGFFCAVRPVNGDGTWSYLCIGLASSWASSVWEAETQPDKTQIRVWVEWRLGLKIRTDLNQGCICFGLKGNVNKGCNMCLVGFGWVQVGSDGIVLDKLGFGLALPEFISISGVPELHSCSTKIHNGNSVLLLACRHKTDLDFRLVSKHLNMDNFNFWVDPAREK